MQQVSLRFGKIEIEYKQQKPDGAAGEVTRAGWDVKANRPGG
jgi:type VI protein secretion system component Hcp